MALAILEDFIQHCHPIGPSIVFSDCGGHDDCLGSDGPIFNFSDTWQLIINTGTTIITFLMVFIIQNTQNRDGADSSQTR